MVYSSNAKHLEEGTIIELAFTKDLNVTFLLKSVINCATLIYGYLTFD